MNFYNIFKLTQILLQSSTSQDFAYLYKNLLIFFHRLSAQEPLTYVKGVMSTKQRDFSQLFAV